MPPSSVAATSVVVQLASSSPASPRPSPGGTVLVEKSARQQYDRYHRQSSLCLPSTQEGMHPALVLVKQKGLVCAQVCEQRMQNTAKVLDKVDALDLEKYIGDTDANRDGRIDQSEFRHLIQKVCEKNDAYAITEHEVDLLTHFVPVDKDCLVADCDTVLMSKLKMALTLWILRCEYRGAWAKDISTCMTNVQILEGLKELNGRSKVDMREAAWIKEKFLSMNCSPDVEETKLMLSVAYWYSAPQARAKQGLNRRQLILRIELERRLRNGCWRFILWAGVYVFLAVSLIRSRELDSCRGISANLESQLSLEVTKQVTTVLEVENYMKEFSRLSAKLSPLSRVYFGGGNAWILQDAKRKFEEPLPLPPLLEPDSNEEGVAGMPLSIGRSFTMQAWVQFDVGMPLPSSGVSLLRKALGNSGQDSVHSCWSWHFPPALSYGAHDYGGVEANTITALMEEHVNANYPESDRKETRRSVLHTLLVNPTKVVFMVDDRVLDEKPLPRPVTDCQRRDITIGDRGLTLAAVRFYPKELTVKEVSEIFRAGSRMMDIGYIVSPPRAKAMDKVAALSLGMEQKIDSLESHSADIEEAAWASSVITGASLRGVPEWDPYVNSDHPVHYRPSDPVVGHPYWEIYKEELYTDKTSKNLANSSALPAAPAGGGFTLSAWLKLNSESGSGYFMSLSMPTFNTSQVGGEPTPEWSGFDNLCWFIFVGGSYTGFYTSSASSASAGPTYFLDDLAGEASWHFTGISYRHMVFQINPQDPDRPLRVCIDGVCTGQAAIDKYAELENISWPPAADCSQTGTVKSYTEEYREQAVEQSRLYLNRRPLDDFHLTAWQMNTKYFNRVLTEAEIKRLFQNDPDPEDPNGLPIRQTRGCRERGELQDDPLFKDDYGNDCYWYFQNRLVRPEVCIGPARKACPMACLTAEICWGSKDEEGQQSFKIWEQQMDFETHGPSGTMCVASSTTPEKEAIKCALNAPNFPICAELQAKGHAIECGPKNCSEFEHDRSKLVQCLNNTRWVPENQDNLNLFVACKDIVELSRAECAWDDSKLDSMAASIHERGAWSLSFWFESASTLDCAQPQLRLIDGDGGTFAWLGPMSGLVDDYAAGPGWLPGCSKSRWLAHGPVSTLETGLQGGGSGSMSADVQAPRAKPGKKHFIMLGRQEDGSVGVHYNEHYNREATVTGLRPLAGDRNFLRVINIGGNVRLSSMVLRSYFPNVGVVGQLRFSQQVEQDRRVGPSRPLYQQLNDKLVREPRKFSQKTMMISPPLVLQKRNKAGVCKSDFSNEIVAKVQRHGMLSQCSAPYHCPNYTVEDVSTCPTELDEEDEIEHFGHLPVHYSSERFYMEFLFSIADNAVLVRNELVEGQRKLVFRNTNEYFDLLTKSIKILALFYSVEFGITSLLTISFDTQEGRVTASHDIEHYVALMDSALVPVYILLIFSLIFLFFIVVDMIPSTRKQVQVYRALKTVHWPSIRESLVDAMLGVMSFVIILIILLRLGHSATNTKEVLGDLTSFDWNAGRDEDLQVLKQDFMDNYERVATLFHQENRDGILTTLLSVILLVRLVACTSAHPRIELITKTLQLATSDIMHFFALMLIIFVGFACLGNWLFGRKRQEFRTISSSMFNLFDSTFGPPGVLPLGFDQDGVHLIFAFLFHVVCFLFLLNFMLAIIVDAYTKVMEMVRVCVVDQNIISDLCSVVQYQVLLYRHQFPLRRVVVCFLNQLDVDVVVPEDLYPNNSGNQIFPNKQVADAYFRFYSNFSFLIDDVQEAEAPTLDDLATIMALTMHKVELVQQQVDAIHDTTAAPVADRSSGRKSSQLKVASTSLGQLKGGPPALG